ncbi:MAG: NAD(P)-binding domain-containing protein, partial [Alistipes sp.]|nr:NAD(P)-binding domain-containing protein [Alistipes sp.]
MRIAIIGAGNMGGAIARALAKCPSLKEAQIICTTKSQSSLDRLRELTPHMHFTLDNCAAVASADIVLLAVKPWLMPEVVEQIRPALKFEQQ